MQNPIVKKAKTELTSLHDVIKGEDPKIWIQKVVDSFDGKDLIKNFSWREQISLGGAAVIYSCYVKFLAMKAVLSQTGNENIITPSYPICKMWRYHILDTHSYAQACNKICGMFIHHTEKNSHKSTMRLLVARTMVLLWFKELPGPLWIDDAPFRVCVKDLKGTELQVYVTSSHTKEDILRGLVSGAGTPQLTCNDHVLCDGIQIKEYGIKSGDTITLEYLF